jgi:hypothetical protein
VRGNHIDTADITMELLLLTGIGQLLDELHPKSPDQVWSQRRRPAAPGRWGDQTLNHPAAAPIQELGPVLDGRHALGSKLEP